MTEIQIEMRATRMYDRLISIGLQPENALASVRAMLDVDGLKVPESFYVWLIGRGGGPKDNNERLNLAREALNRSDVESAVHHYVDLDNDLSCGGYLPTEWM
jgi:hypothetical protein